MSHIVLSQDSLVVSIENSDEYNFQLPKNSNSIKRFSVFHEQFLLCVDYKQNQIFLGPQYSYFSGYLYDPVDEYKKNAFGINIGYQYNYLIKNRLSNTSFITRLSFSLYEYKTIEHSMGPGEFSRAQTIVENNLYLGLKKKIKNKIYIQGGIGIGSTQGFFLMIESFMLSSTFCLGINL